MNPSRNMGVPSSHGNLVPVPLNQTLGGSQPHFTNHLQFSDQRGNALGHTLSQPQGHQAAFSQFQGSLQAQPAQGQPHLSHNQIETQGLNNVGHGASPSGSGSARRATPEPPSKLQACSGVCMMSNKWKEEQHPNFINFISSFLAANSFRLNFVPIAPDFIFNCGGLSAAFMFVTSWNMDCTLQVYSRALKLKEQFAHFYVVVTLPSKEQNDSFVRSYFKFGFHFGKPPFVPVVDLEMGFEKIVKIAHSLGVCKQQDVISRMKDERKQAMQSMDAFLKVVTSIPGLDNHDANSLIQAIGSIEDIAKASKEYLLENSDLSAEKADNILRFFRDPKFYLSPKFN